MITIPETDLVVHELCLGTNVFGWSADERQSHAVHEIPSSETRPKLIDGDDMPPPCPTNLRVT